MARKNINYIIEEEIITLNNNQTLESLIQIFNEKYYRTIMKLEDNI